MLAGLPVAGKGIGFCWFRKDSGEMCCRSCGRVLQGPNIIQCKATWTKERILWTENVLDSGLFCVRNEIVGG
jgi:hypothetical protein